MKIELNVTRSSETTTPAQKRRGRPRGKSSVVITMDNLTRYVGPLGSVVVSRRWLKSINYPV